MNNQNLNPLSASECDELRDLLPEFAAGGVSREEAEHVQALLAKCPEMQQEFAQYAAVLNSFFERIEPVSPPADLHDKLMRKLREDESEPEADSDQYAQQV